jgi:hypothetical protein
MNAPERELAPGWDPEPDVAFAAMLSLFRANPLNGKTLSDRPLGASDEQGRERLEEGNE